MESTCTLETGARERRRSDWEALRGDALISESHNESGSVSVFANTPEVRRRLEALIAAEADCCSFLRFVVMEENDRLVVDVSASGDR